MRKFARLPAFFVLLAASATGVGMVIVHNARTAGPTTAGAELEKRLDELGNKVANGTADGKTWFDYAELLRQAGRYHHAAEAYKRALACSDVPDIHAAQYGRGLALARDTDDDAYFAYLEELVASDAKTVLVILDSADSDSKKASAKFGPMHQSAENQAAD